VAEFPLKNSYFSITCALAIFLMVMTLPMQSFARTSRTAPYKPPNAYIVMDASTGMVISQSDADRTLYPASLTKLMTLLLTFEMLDEHKISLQTPIVMTSHAANMPPSKLGLKPGETISVENAIKALVTKSANDIAVAVGENLGGSEDRFAQMMNLKARQLGMEQTHFVNACGLHDIRQTSSARDMGKLAFYILQHYPHYYSYFSIKEFRYKGAVHTNHNHLMSSYRGMDGMKTGFVAASGFNLVASAKRGNTRLIGVVFGGRTSGSRNAQMSQLLDDGFERAGEVRLLKPQMVDNAPPAVSLPTPKAPSPILEKIPGPSTKIAAVKTEDTAAKTIQPAPKTAAKPDVKSAASKTKATKKSLSGLVSKKADSYAMAPAPSADPVPNPKNSGNGWSVQIGAYQDRPSTDQALYKATQKLPAPLNLGEAMIIPLKTSQSTWVFRARIGGFTKEQALQACRYLDDCLTISPTAN
jgi:D-alanyl-D-alanine carboxypeptidase